jgi:hypothetical protein
MGQGGALQNAAMLVYGPWLEGAEVTTKGKVPRKLGDSAGIIGLATAVLGLIGTAIAVWSGAREVVEPDEPVAAATIPVDDLSNVPAVIDGYMSGPAFIDLWSRHTLCYDWRADPGTCHLTGVVTQRAARRVRAMVTQFVLVPQPAFSPLDMIVVEDARDQGRVVPPAYAMAEEEDYSLTREGICTTNAERAEGAARTHIFVSSPDGPNTLPLSPEGLAAFRTALANQYSTQAVGEEQCWRYRFEQGEPDQVVQDYFLDGVRQPDQSLTLALIPLDREVGLHLPNA